MPTVAAFVRACAPEVTFTRFVAPVEPAGVSTDCCVLSTATAAADAGVPVQVVADACAGIDEASHRKTLDVLALYTPLVEIVTSADLLSGRRVSRPGTA